MPDFHFFHARSIDQSTLLDADRSFSLFLPSFELIQVGICPFSDDPGLFPFIVLECQNTNLKCFLVSFLQNKVFDGGAVVGALDIPQ